MSIKSGVNGLRDVIETRDYTYPREMVLFVKTMNAGVVSNKQYTLFYSNIVDNNFKD